VSICIKFFSFTQSTVPAVELG